MADQCETCENSPHPGILWPWMPNGDDSLPWVEKCDDCDIYTSDEEAASGLAMLIGMRVMWAEAPIESDESDYGLRPFVFAFIDSTLEQETRSIGGGRIKPLPMYDKWLRERTERFGPRRPRYDEAAKEANV